MMMNWLTDKAELYELFRAFPHALVGVARVFMFGALKHGRNNYRSEKPSGNSGTVEGNLNAALRHIKAYADGRRTDIESHLPSLYHAAWRVLRAAELSAKGSDLRAEREKL